MASARILVVLILRWVFPINAIVTELERGRRELTEIHKLLQAQAEQTEPGHQTDTMSHSYRFEHWLLVVLW